MTREEFIKTIAPYHIKYAKKYGVNIVSSAIAQGCLESGFGSADNIKVKNLNFYGLKYRPNRLTCNLGVVEDTSKEQNPDGSYRDIITNWYSFKDIESGVEGYYQFINISNYKKVREAKDPLTYLQEIKKAGYASSLDYINKVYKIVQDYNLTIYDKEVKQMEEFKFDCVDFKGKKQGDRTKPVSKITIHHMAGKMTAKRCAEYHRDSKKKASANFYIGYDGDIVQGIPQNKKAWTSSSSENDNVAITIECSNNGGAPDWTISDKTYQSLINLCVYLCKKYNINPYFDGTKNGTITIHKMFSRTACPGPYLERLITSHKLEEDIKKNLTNNNMSYNKTEETKEVKQTNNNFLVRVKINNLNIRELPTAASKSKGYIKPGVYTIVEKLNNWGKLKSGAGYICLDYTERI